jgi:hypothetical protein
VAIGRRRDRWFGRTGAWGAILGMGLLTITELIAISGAESPYPIPTIDRIESLYGIASTRSRQAMRRARARSGR